MKDDLVCETIKRRDGEWMWTCVGPKGGVHILIFESVYHGMLRYSGGREVHSKAPFDYAPQSEPSHEQCWLIKCPCWHDGSSLYVSETVVPYWLVDRNNDERMLDFLKKEYRHFFEGDE